MTRWTSNVLNLPQAFNVMPLCSRRHVLSVTSATSVLRMLRDFDEGNNTFLFTGHDSFANSILFYEGDWKTKGLRMPKLQFTRGTPIRVAYKPTLGFRKGL